MAKASPQRHATLSLPFSERALLPETPPLTAYLYRLMAHKRTNLCLSADLQTTSQLLELAEECGDSICILKTHADIISDFGERTIKGLTDIAVRKKFLIFEDRKFGDIGNTVQMQYAAGHHRIASWASIVNAHIFPGPAIITSLRSAAFSAVAANNSTIVTEITGGHSAGDKGYFGYEETGDGDIRDTDADSVSGSDSEVSPSQHCFSPFHSSGEGNSPKYHRKNSVVSISTTITSSHEYISPPASASGGAFDPRPPLSRGLLLLAQMSSADNLFTSAYTQRCVELAREHKDFVLGFIAQESLNSSPNDNFVVMAPGVNLPTIVPPSPAHSKSPILPISPRLQTMPSGSSSRPPQPIRTSGLNPSPDQGLSGDGQGQQYNHPRRVVLDKGVDVIIVGRGILNADDRALEAARYRREGWKAITERCGGKT